MKFHTLDRSSHPEVVYNKRCSLKFRKNDRKTPVPKSPF